MNRKLIYSKVLAVFSFVLFSFYLSAQQHYPKLISESIAIDMLQDEIRVIENDLSQQTQNSSEAILLERALLMHVHAQEELVRGERIASALDFVFAEFAIDATGNSYGLDEMMDKIKLNPSKPNNDIDYFDPAFTRLVKLLSL